MEYKMVPPPPSAHESDKIVAIAEKRSLKHSQVSKEDPHAIAEDMGRITIKLKKNSQEEASQIISQKFPEASYVLKERLAISVERRRTRFLNWRQQAHEGIVVGKKATSLTAFETKHSRDPLGSESGSYKPIESVSWENEEDFPTPPKIESSQSHFLCQICFLSTPSEAAKGDLWIQHVLKDLKAYICLIEGCQSPQNAFSTFEEWIDHMKEDQRRPDSYVFMSCPLCSYPLDKENLESSVSTYQELLQQHIAGHLQSLALNSLPTLHSDSEAESDNSDGSSRAAHSQLDPPEPLIPLIPFGNQVYPDLRFGEREFSRGSRQGSTFVPGKLDNEFVPPLAPRVNSTNITFHQMWRQREEQTANTETFDILVAEDNIVNQKLFSKILGKDHHTVVIAKNGQEALNSVKKRKYDVILMDISMPGMGGVEATQKIREYERSVGSKRTPIIALFVCSVLHEDMEKIFQVQMDDYLSKPVTIKCLREKVLRYGRLGRSTAGNVHQFLASISGPTESPRRTATNFRAKL